MQVQLGLCEGSLNRLLSRDVTQVTEAQLIIQVINCNESVRLSYGKLQSMLRYGGGCITS